MPVRASSFSKRLPDRLLTFGVGALVVDVGKYEGQPAVFICKAKKPGAPGESAEREGNSRFELQPDEIVMRFGSDEQARRVADVLCGQYPSTGGER